MPPPSRVVTSVHSPPPPPTQLYFTERDLETSSLWQRRARLDDTIERVDPAGLLLLSGRLQHQTEVISRGSDSPGTPSKSAALDGHGGRDGGRRTTTSISCPYGVGLDWPRKSTHARASCPLSESSGPCP